MRNNCSKFLTLLAVVSITGLGISSQAQLLWTVGLDDNGWPVGDGGGANASFVQETGAISALPGSPTSPETNQQADNDYYFAGDYTTVIAGNGVYTPVGVVAANEEAAERAFAAADNDLRYHFNLPGSLNPFDLLSVTFDALNLDDPNAVNTDPRYGIEVYINGVLVQTQILIRPVDLGTDYTTPPFSLASVNAQTGPGFDNIVSLRGISYNAEGGGNWMGIDYVQLNVTSGGPPPATGYAAAVQADGPIAYWRFNDTGSVATNSGSLGATADGTYQGDAAAGALAPRPPRLFGFESDNKALQLDGAGDFVTSLAGLMNGRPVFTMSGWIRRGADQADRTGLWGQNDLVEFGYINNNTLEVWTDNGLHQSPDPTTNPFPNGEWAHVAFVSEGSPGTLKLYTNGVFANERTHTMPVDNTFPFNIGGGGVFDAIAANGNYFNGQIDEVAVFDKALTANQILAQYYAGAGAPPLSASLVKGYVVKERYDNIGNSVNLIDLTNNAKYINHQVDSSCLRTDFSANDANECNDCGLVVRGFFIPKVSGPHTFYLSADDGAALFLSTDELPANKVQIAAEPLWAGRRNYIGEADGGGRGDPPTNVSAPIDLVAGSYYYIEGAVKEAGGGDNLDVAVQGPGDPAVADGDRPVFGDRIAVIADLTGSSLAITSNPVSIRVAEGDSASFTVGADAVSPLCGGNTTYQWQRNGVDIPGANGANYTYGPVPQDDHLATFRAVVGIPGLTRTSASATLEVLGRECLRVTGATGSGDLIHATVQFSSFVNATNPGSIDIFNYAISGPGGSTLGVTAAALGGDGKSVTLTTDAQAENTDYTVSVMNVESIVGTTICESPTNMATFHSYQLGPCGGVVFEQYLGLTGTTVATLTNSAKFPNSPDVVRILPSFAAGVGAGENFGDNYGGRLRGLFIPDATASYIFYISSDDSSQLFINPTGPSAAGKVLVQADAGCCGNYTAHATAPIPMTAGQGYYIEAIYQEGGGGDYCYVAVRKQGEAAPVGRAETDAIPGNLLGYPAAPAGIGGPVTITQQPANVSVTENGTAIFSVGASNSNGLPICYQWFDNDVEIAGAINPTHTIPLAPLSANGHVFKVRVSVIGSTVLSGTATLTVTTDNVDPQALSASGGVNYSNIVVQFSELLDPGSAQDLFNYSVAGRAVVAAALQSGGQSVLLQVDPALAPDTAYTVTVQNVTDLAGNALSPSPTNLSFRTYAISCGFALEQLYFNIPGVLVTDLTSNPNYPNNPSVQTYVGLLAGPTDTYDNYGTRVSGVLIPPVSGAYNFFMSSDDGGAFYLSTDSSPGNAVLICSEPTWNASRDWVGTTRRNVAAPENRSSTLFPAGIALVAGQHYYFELLAKEGGGGDNCAATWQLPGAPLPVNGSPPIAGIYMGAPANPVGASLAITQQPVDQTVTLPASTPVSFTVGVSASTQGNTNPPVFYQWYRDNGTGFNPVSGGNSARLEFIPALADNGAQFRAQVYIPGATATSQVARLTVTGGQPPNSPPSFTCGTNVPPVQENAGAQTVPGVATDILPHSVVRTPIQISYDFSTIPDGSTMINRVLDLPSDVSLVRDGLLKLTDAVNGSQGGFLTAPLPSIIDSFTVSFKARIGGGTCCGAALPDGSGVSRPADGLSVTIGDILVPLSFPVAAEEGAAVGAGVVVAFDTWDNNGTDEAPAVDVKAGGSVVAFQSLDGEREGGRPPAGPLVNDPATGLPLSYRTGTNFANVRVHLDADGTLDVDFKNVRVINNVQIGLGAFANGRIAFGGRTGGANDNQWIDDLQIQAFPLDASSGESGQTVTFTASNNNPSLFSVQPAVSPDGTLTYTPAPGACGTAIVTFVAKDNGGTANGGNDTSAPCSVAINVICDGGTNACPVANAQSVTVPTGGSVPIVLTATDADGDALAYSVVSGPSHGALSGTPPNLTYTPTAGYSGADSFVFKASDGDTNCNSTATVSITVRPSTGTNQPPVARILAKTLYDFRPNITNPVVISCNGSNAHLLLNGTRSTDPEGGALTYAWVLEPGAAPFSTNGLTEVDLDLTTQTIQLAVTDPQGNVGLDSLTVEVITIGEAIDELTDKVRECTLPRAQKRSLIATLKVASALSHRGNDLFWEDDGYEDSCWRLQLAADILWVFEWKVWLHLIHRDPDLALCLMDWADQIICAIDECPCDDGGEDDYDIDYPLDP